MNKNYPNYLTKKLWSHWCRGLLGLSGLRLIQEPVRTQDREDPQASLE